MDLEAEYDNGAKVPGYEIIKEGWRRDAAAFRAACRDTELDVPYGPTLRQKLDLFWPDAGQDVPLAMFLHGGYWQLLGRSWFSHLAGGLVARGIGVAIPSYDLCPQIPLAMLVEQVRAAAAFLHRRHGRKLLAFGHSAGGHLTAMLMVTDWAARGLPRDLVPAGLPISGLFDLPPLLHTTVNRALGLDEAEARRLSPLFLPRPGGRLHAVVGGTEGAEYTRQSRAIAEAWGGTWESVPSANHFTIVAPLADPGSDLVARLLDLLPR